MNVVARMEPARLKVIGSESVFGFFFLIYFPSQFICLLLWHTIGTKHFFFKLPTIGGSTAGCWNCNFFEDPNQIILVRLLTPLSAQRGEKCESPVLNYLFYSKESLWKIPSALLWGRDIYLQGMIGKNTGKVRMDNWVISWFPPNKPLSYLFYFN